MQYLRKTLYKRRCRDNNHITGAFQGSVYIECTVNFKQKKTITVIFRNLKHYDAHFKNYHIDVIANAMEKYFSFNIKKIDCLVKLLFLFSISTGIS